MESFIYYKKKQRLMNENMKTLNKEKNVETIISSFNKNYVQGILRQIEEKEVPEKVKKFFEGHSQLFIDLEDYIQGNFSQYYVIDKYNSEQIYIAQQTKTYTKTNNNSEELTYIFETKNETKIGHGEIRYNYTSKEDFFVDKPFVGFSSTEDEFLRKGYGLERLKLMNELTKSIYHLKLHSSTTIRDNARKVWSERLIKEGSAKQYFQEERERFQFIK